MANSARSPAREARLAQGGQAADDDARAFLLFFTLAGHDARYTLCDAWPHEFLNPPCKMNTSKYIVLLMLAVVAVFVSCSTKSSIVGKWQEIGGTETLEFFKDGTLSVVNKGTAITGKYSFLDDTRIKLEIGGIVGALAGSQIVTVSIADGELSLTDQKGKVSRYRK